MWGETVIRDPFMPKLIARGLRPIGELAASRPHGDRLRYMAGCHCFKCRRANSDYERMRQAARLAGDWNGIIDAAPARAHLLKLSRAGVGQWSVVAATDIARSMIHEIRNGDRLRIDAPKLMSADVKKRITVVWAILGVFFVIPIHLYLLHWLLVHSDAGDLQMFLFWVYLPVSLIVSVLQRVMEK
jgi:hypothetical protein